MNNIIYGGFWKRFLAMLIDGVILIIPSIVFNVAIPYVGGAILGLFYRPIFDASPLGASPGRALMGLKIISENGEKITLKQAYIRYFSSILSGLLMCFGFIMSLFNSKNQTLHDMIAGTVVIEAETPSVNFFKYWLDEVSQIFDRVDTPVAPSVNSPSQGQAASATETQEPSKAPAESKDITQQMMSLKYMLDQGLITAEDYENKKAELLAKL